MRCITVGIALSLVLVPAGAFAKAAQCRDAKGHFSKCAPASAPAASTGAMSSMAAVHFKSCKKGKTCGNTCISVKEVCHK